MKASIAKLSEKLTGTRKQIGTYCQFLVCRPYIQNPLRCHLYGLLATCFYANARAHSLVWNGVANMEVEASRGYVQISVVVLLGVLGAVLIACPRSGLDRGKTRPAKEEEIPRLETCATPYETSSFQPIKTLAATLLGGGQHTDLVQDLRSDQNSILSASCPTRLPPASPVRDC